MKRCDPSLWLRLCASGSEIYLLESERLRNLTRAISNPDDSRPSLVVLIGNRAKTIALREVFNVKHPRRSSVERSSGDIHLHTDPSTIFLKRPLFVAEGDVAPNHLRGTFLENKCHKLTRRVIRRAHKDISLDQITSWLYTDLLYPFVDSFCLFCDDLGGLESAAHVVAAWLQRGHSSTLPQSTLPNLSLVIEKNFLEVRNEEEARKLFLSCLSRETTEDLFEQVSTLEIIAVFPRSTISSNSRHRLLKERLMDGIDRVQHARKETQVSFSLRHFTSFLEAACKHFAEHTNNFDFIRFSRVHYPTRAELEEHLLNFLKHISSSTELTEFAAPAIASSLFFQNYPPDTHLFEPTRLFDTIYIGPLQELVQKSISRLEECPNADQWLQFIKAIRTNFQHYFSLLTQESKSAADIHRGVLARFKKKWQNIQSTSTCLPCLSRRPQHGLPCGHVLCESCIRVMGENSTSDPWLFRVHVCPLCNASLPDDVSIRIHPPTAGVGVLCIDGGGTRGILPLQLMKRIHDRIGLSIPFQKYFKVAFGISSGGLIILSMFLNGWSIDESSVAFEKLAKVAFQKRKVPRFPLFPRLLDMLISYLNDGVYPPQNIEAALKQVFSPDRTILDCSKATTDGAYIGLPVATTSDTPSCRIFTNYNGVGRERTQNQGQVMKPKDGKGRVPFARSLSAAPGFFPPKRIRDVGTFQDAGPLENDPIISALSEVAALFPSITKPDFIVSLGTGEPIPRDDPLDTPRNVWKNGALPRLGRLLWEKMRDKKVRQLFQAQSRYHRLNVQFKGTEPRLDDTEIISELKSRALEDQSLSKSIEGIAHSLIASLFYFELDTMPERIDGKHVGTGRILCSVRRGDPAFSELFNQLSNTSAYFLLDGDPITSETIASSVNVDSEFQISVGLITADEFAISLKRSGSESFNISNSPFSVEKLIEAQGLRASFGRTDHRKRKAPDLICERKKRPRTQ